jgi:hypothetical protein
LQVGSSSSSSSQLWQHTPASLLLRKDHPDSLRDTALFMGGVQYAPSFPALFTRAFMQHEIGPNLSISRFRRYQAAASLPWAVAHGQSHFHRTYNQSAFEWSGVLKT